MTAQLLPVLDRPRQFQNLYDENGVFYPEEDGIPLADGFYQEPLFVRAVSTLEMYFSDQPEVAVSGNTFVYYQQGAPQRFVAPDCYVAFGVDVDHIIYRNTYRVWEMGKAPDFALEIASESTARRDVNEKPALYASIGFGEYWLYDGTADSKYYGAPLQGGYLADGRYEPFDIITETDGLIWGHSPALGLDLCWDDGRLRYRNPESGEFLMDYEEYRAAYQESEAAVQEYAAALQESDTALQASEAARQESDTALQASETARIAAEAEAAALREQLRQLQAV